MNLTRRGWVTVGCLALFPLGTRLFDVTAGLYAGAVLGGWLLALQASFILTLTTLTDDLEVSASTDRQYPRVEEAVTVTLAASVPEPPSIPVTLTMETPPSAASDGHLELTIPSGDPRAKASEPDSSADASVRFFRSLQLTWRVAGTYEIGPPRVTATDPVGLFRESFDQPATVSIEVRTQEPETAHLGRSGEQITAAFGDHSGGRIGSGIEPATLRRYQPSDEVSRIDWKATARLQEAYVVDTISETDRRTVLFLDHRSTMGGDRGAPQPIEYAIHAGLAFVDSAREVRDPLACFTVGDGGVTGEYWPGTGAEHYRSIASHLRSSTPTVSTERASRPAVGTPTRDATDAVARATTLAGDEDRFARTLAPFLEDIDPYVHRVDDQPLYAAVRTYLGSFQGSVFAVILTDDSRRAELREAVKFASRGTNSALAVLTPKALFDGSVTPAERRQQHGEFEAFRQSLSAMAGVRALELAPDDRVSSVLERDRGGVNA